MNLPVLSIALIVLGIACILYCLGIALFVNFGTRFFLIWGVGGALLAVLGWLIGFTGFWRIVPLWLKITAGVVIGAGLLLLIVVEGMILSRFGAKAPAGADYVIVLGAQIRADGPSYVLQKRLDAALLYLQENPETQVIVSGGKGANEPVSEAEGMYDYLKERGIAEERILLETQSRNTYENLSNSSSLLQKETDEVVIVTNNFHVFRALGIARQEGYGNVYGLAADSYPLMLPNNMLREFFGVIKDRLAGNL